MLIVSFMMTVCLLFFYVVLKIYEPQLRARKRIEMFVDGEKAKSRAVEEEKEDEENSGILSGEFHICLEEIRLGKTRKEALSGIKERLEFDEIKSLINNILQAEKLGISIVQVLRVKSAEERDKRKQRAEEAAMKAPIKILFPLVLFIFPSIFIVLLGPAVIQLMNGFK
jgi:pilus assembly protein TadC